MQTVTDRKVRDFFALKAYSGVYTLDHLSPDVIIQSYIFTPDSKETMAAILREMKKAPGTDRKPCIISGDRGMGKSHTMRVLREVLKNPSLVSLIEDPWLRREMAALAGKQYLVVDIHCLPLVEESLKAMFYLAFENALREASVQSLPPIENWLDLEDSDDQLRFIRDFIPAGQELVIFLDDIAEKLISYRNATRIIGDLEFLLTLALSSGIYPIFLVAAFFDHVLNPPEFTTRYRDIHTKISEYKLSTAFLIRRISKAHLIDLIKTNILVKSAQQKLELEKLHHHFQNTVPFFSTPMEQFVDLYPIHPAVFHISFFMHRYIRNFSLLSFVYSTASRLLSYRCTALATPDTIFDLLYHEVKKIPDLRIAVESYETINQQVTAALPMSVKVQARMLLKALFLFSVTEEYKPTPEHLIDALLLSEFQGRPTSREAVMGVLDHFEEQVPQCIRKSVTPAGTEYHLVTIEHASIDFLINEIKTEEAGLEERMQRILFQQFFRQFPDLTVGKEQSGQPIQDETLRVEWRGLFRQGALLWTPKALNIIVSSKTQRAHPIFRDYAGTDANIGELRTMDVAPNKTPDWQISAFSLVNEPLSTEAVSELAHRYPTHLLWMPGPVSKDDLEKLETAAILLSDEYRVKFFDVEEEYLRRRNAAEVELQRSYMDKYLREGKLVLLGRSISIEELLGEEIEFGHVISAAVHLCMERVFPEHPLFPEIFSEAPDLACCIQFLLNGSFTDPVRAKTVGGMLQSLSLATRDGERWVFDPLQEHFGESPEVADFMAMVSGHPTEWFPLAVIYEGYADSPLGLEKSVVDCLFAALIAAGKIKLFDCEKPESHVLHRNSLTPEIDFSFYDAVQAMAEESLPLPELLQWGFTLCRAQMETGNITQNRRLLKNLLSEWMDFHQASPLEKSILDLPIELQTTFLWKELQSTRRSAAAITACVGKILEQQCSLEDGLMQMAQTFSNSLPAFLTILEEIDNVRDFMGWAGEFVQAKNYVLSSEKTTDPKVENLRCELFSHFERPSRLLQKDRREHFQSLYGAFKKHYTAYYVECHASQAEALLPEKPLAKLLATGWWGNLPLLARIEFADKYAPRAINMLIEQLRERRCSLDVAQILNLQPYCECGFHVGASTNLDALAERIVGLAERARQSQIQFLTTFKKMIIRELQKIPSLDDETARQVVSLANGNLEGAISLNAIKLINFILKRKASVVSSLPKSDAITGRVCRKEAVVQHFNDILKTIEESKESHFLLTEPDELPSSE